MPEKEVINPEFQRERPSTTPIGNELSAIEGSISDLRQAVHDLKENLYTVLVEESEQPKEQTTVPPKPRSKVPMVDRLQFMNEAIREAIGDISEIKDRLAV